MPADKTSRFRSLSPASYTLANRDDLPHKDRTT
jgi:hypothetical protein